MTSSSASALHYDDNAFTIFSASLLLILLTLWLFRHLRSLAELVSLPVTPSNTCQCRICQHKLKSYRNNKKISSTAIAKTLIIIFLYCVIFKNFKAQIKQNALGHFDPFEVLQTDRNATPKQIRRAFKLRAKECHPDLFPNNPQKQTEFMTLQRAYKCLQDEETLSNCEQFGNPEGRATFNIGIALPSLLLNKANSNTILLLLFGFLLIVVPAGFFWAYNFGRKFDENGSHRSVQFLTLQILRNQHIRFRDFLEMLSMSHELRRLRTCRGNQASSLKSSFDPAFEPKMGSKRFKPFLKLFHLIHIYMTRRSVGESLKGDIS